MEAALLIFKEEKYMANSINGNISQMLRGGNTDKSSGISPKPRQRGPSQKVETKKAVSAGAFGESAKVEFSPEVEMYGKVVDLLQKKYDNADVFVAGPNDDLSQIGGDLEYSIILSEDEMKLLASEDPKDKDAKDKLMGRIDDAMNTISKMSEKIGENTDENDEISNFGIKFDKAGNMNFFADVNGKSYIDNSMDALIKNMVSDKTAN
jgi:hypothetical protein